MSKKRTATESNFDEKTIQNSDSFQQQDNAKRAKLASLSDTTLQDLPIEMLEHILIKVVTTEVKDSKLVKEMWKEKVDHVINRLITVSPLWSSIITSDIFRNKVDRTLDGTAQRPIRLEILKQSSLEVFALDVTSLKDEMFVLWRNDNREYSINVYDLDNLDQVKDVIPLQGRNPLNLTACSVSNCVYLLDKKQWFEVTVLRITKDAKHQFNVSALISIPWLPRPTLSVTTTGGFILSKQRGKDYAVICIYDADGSLKQEMKVNEEISSIGYIIRKSNGNLVLVTDEGKPALTLTNPNGSVLIRLMPGDNTTKVSRADMLGRTLITEERLDRIVLAEFGRDVSTVDSPQLREFYTISPSIWHYNCERHEIVGFTDSSADGRGVLTILGFMDE